MNVICTAWQNFIMDVCLIIKQERHQRGGNGHPLKTVWPLHWPPLTSFILLSAMLSSGVKFLISLIRSKNINIYSKIKNKT